MGVDSRFLVDASQGGVVAFWWMIWRHIGCGSLHERQIVRFVVCMLVVLPRFCSGEFFFTYCSFSGIFFRTSSVTLHIVGWQAYY